MTRCSATVSTCSINYVKKQDFRWNHWKLDQLRSFRHRRGVLLLPVRPHPLAQSVVRLQQFSNMRVTSRPVGRGLMENTLAVIILITVIKSAKSWENSDLEMFDLVEEVGQNFYEVLGIPQVRLHE